jgi:hypothetical protein
MTKPAQLANIFAQPVSQEAPAPVKTRPEPVETELPRRRSPGTNYHRTTRHGVATYLDREAHRQLKKIAFDEDTEIQELVREGINLVFAKRRLQQIA